MKTKTVFIDCESRRDTEKSRKEVEHYKMEQGKKDLEVRKLRAALVRGEEEKVNVCFKHLKANSPKLMGLTYMHQAIYNELFHRVYQKQKEGCVLVIMNMILILYGIFSIHE